MDIKDYAKKQLSTVLGEGESSGLYKTLVLKQQIFSEVLPDTFSMEYLALKLAIAAVVWKAYCKTNSLQLNSEEDLFFEYVMACFKTPKMTTLASAFSEYIYAADEVALSEMCLAMARYMFKRLKVEEKIQRGAGDPKISPALEAIVIAFEGFRTAFENEFDDFLFSDFEH